MVINQDSHSYLFVYMDMYIFSGFQESKIGCECCVEMFSSDTSHPKKCLYYGRNRWKTDVTNPCHYGDVIMGAIASQITSLTIVYSTVYSDVDQRKHQSSASLAFVWGIHRGPVNSPQKWPVTRKMFPFDDVIMRNTFRSDCDMAQFNSIYIISSHLP